MRSLKMRIPVSSTGVAIPFRSALWCEYVSMPHVTPPPSFDFPIRVDIGGKMWIWSETSRFVSVMFWKYFDKDVLRNGCIAWALYTGKSTQQIRDTDANVDVVWVLQNHQCSCRKTTVGVAISGSCELERTSHHCLTWQHVCSVANQMSNAIISCMQRVVCWECFRLFEAFRCFTHCKTSRCFLS